MRRADRSSGRNRVLRAGLVTVIVTATLVACRPVTPSVAYSHSTFEGFDVVSYVPAHPRALAFLFHGSFGSSEFAEKTETVDVLNTLVARGYGFVATSSTERTGDKRWDVFDPSLVTNPDLARLLRLRRNLIATTGVDATTPLVATGVWDSSGRRTVADVDTALTQAATAVLPASVGPQRAAIGDETRVVLAAHQFSAEFEDAVAAFFDRFVGA